MFLKFPSNSKTLVSVYIFCHRKKNRWFEVSLKLSEVLGIDLKILQLHYYSLRKLFAELFRNTPFLNFSKRSFGSVIESTTKIIEHFWDLLYKLRWSWRWRIFFEVLCKSVSFSQSFRKPCTRLKSVFAWTSGGFQEEYFPSGQLCTIWPAEEVQKCSKKIM